MAFFHHLGESCQERCKASGIEDTDTWAQRLEAKPLDTLRTNFVNAGGLLAGDLFDIEEALQARNCEFAGFLQAACPETTSKVRCHLMF